MNKFQSAYIMAKAAHDAIIAVITEELETVPGYVVATQSITPELVRNDPDQVTRLLNFIFNVRTAMDEKHHRSELSILLRAAENLLLEQYIEYMRRLPGLPPDVSALFVEPRLTKALYNPKYRQELIDLALIAPGF